MAGVTNDVPDGSRMIGIPATPEREQKIKQAALSKLPRDAARVETIAAGRRNSRESIVAGGRTVAKVRRSTRRERLRPPRRRVGATSHSCAHALARIGMLAGWGRYPIVIAEALRRQGCEVYCLGTIGHADPALAEVCNDFHFLGLAKFGSAIRYFRRHGVTEVTMAGKIFKVRLFERWSWIRHLPDLRTIRMFMPHFWTRKKDCRDDSLLGAIVEEFASEGIRIAPATDYAPELLVTEGQLTRRGPTAWQQKDIAFGWKLAKEMGRLDVGQSVAVKDQAVLAVEGRRRDRRMHPTRRLALPLRRFYRRESGQAEPGHAGSTCPRSDWAPWKRSWPPAEKCWPSRPVAPSFSTKPP